MEGKVADRCERACSEADATAILAECHIAHIVKPVLDSPMAARQFKPALGTGVGRGQVGDDIGGLRADFSADRYAFLMCAHIV